MTPFHTYLNGTAAAKGYGERACIATLDFDADRLFKVRPAQPKRSYSHDFKTVSQSFIPQKVPA